jgi:DNA mismatch endonuclease (patch repair protein)
MSQIHSKNTKPELIVRKYLWAQGYRYRLHRKDLPGKPDIVLPKYHAIIFVHGCFWHRHNCRFASTPATRKEFWEKKLNGNVERDKRNIQELIRLNWRILVLWECEIKKWDSSLEIKIYDFLLSDTVQYDDDVYDDTASDNEEIQIVAEPEAEYLSTEDSQNDYCRENAGERDSGIYPGCHYFSRLSCQISAGHPILPCAPIRRQAAIRSGPILSAA